MSDVSEVSKQVYGDSWGSFLEKTVAAAEDQPVTQESETEDANDEAGDNGNDHSFDDGEMEDGEDIENGSDESESTVEDALEAIEDTMIELGEGKQPVKLSELKAGYQRQADYTKKTQALAAERKEFETQKEGLQNIQAWHDHMESNPWLWEQVNRALTEFNDTGVLPIEEVLQDAHYGKYVNHLMAENNQLKKQLESASGELEGIKLTTSMQTLRNELQAEYGDLVTDDYMSELQERGKAEKLSAATMKEIAEGHLAKKKMGMSKADLKKVSKQAEAKAIQKLAETKKLNTGAPSRTGARPAASSENTGSQSWGDFLKSKFN